MDITVLSLRFYLKDNYHAILSRSKVGKRCHSGAMLDLVDASSLLYRLQMEGCEITR